MQLVGWEKITSFYTHIEKKVYVWKIDLSQNSKGIQGPNIPLLLAEVTSF